jgi:hypothetical protein
LGFQGKFYQILFAFKPRNFSEFLFKIPSEFEVVHIEKIVHVFEIFKTIFYFKIMELERSFLNRSNFEKMNVFESFKSGNGLNHLIPPPGTVTGPHLATPHLPYFGAGRTCMRCPPQPSPTAWCLPPNRPPARHAAIKSTSHRHHPPFLPRSISSSKELARAQPLSPRPLIHAGDRTIAAPHRIFELAVAAFRHFGELHPRHPLCSTAPHLTSPPSTPLLQESAAAAGSHRSATPVEALLRAAARSRLTIARAHG